MSRQITHRTSVEFLKKGSKQWLKSLEAGEADAIARLKHALPGYDEDNAEQLTLRTVQHALAREYGVDGWLALIGAIESPPLELREIADEILRNTIFGGDPAVGARLYKSHPQIVTLDLFTAVAAGNLAEVNRRLAADPSSASRAGGPLNWPPLLYLTYLRLPGSAAQSVEIARALLDHEADANSNWHEDWAKTFKPLAGVIGLGECVQQPTHERAIELVELFIEHGADPCDSQTLYNIAVAGDDVHWLDVLWSHSERRNVTNTWREVSKQRLGGHRGMSPLNFMLSLTVSRNHLRKAEWLLTHGASAGGAHADSKRRLLNEALVHGNDAMAELLVRYGAVDEPLQGIVAFQVACRRLDRGEARRLTQAHPEFLRDPEVMLIAARQSRADIIELLLELGMDVNIETVAGFRALHTAVVAGAIDVVKVLIAHGADVDRPTDNYGGAMEFAAQYGRHDIAKILAPLSRDVHSMVNLGMKDRLRELFATDPTLANLVHFRTRQTPLFSLPNENASALDMTKLLLEHESDARFVNKKGETAADAARERGLNEAAQLLTDAIKRR